MTAIVWFRSDLRIADNPALHHARAKHEVIVGVFCDYETQWRKHDYGERKIGFIRQTVTCLAADLAALNIPLVYLKAGDFSETLTALLTVINETKCKEVFFNREYELNERVRDQEVSAKLTRLGIDVHSYDDQVIIPPGSLLNKTGGYYQVFSAFKRAWLAQVDHESLSPLAKPRACSQLLLPPDDLVFLNTDPVAPLFPPGEAAAIQRLTDFKQTVIDGYHNDRDIPALPGTSKLSAYLAVGSISPRQCFYAGLMLNDGQLSEGNRGVVAWINELIWREFYRHIIYGFEKVCRYQPFQIRTGTIPWSHNKNLFDAWKRGQTGYPFVDAAMRQLSSTGWMHNRLRMVSAMFLTKHLMIDWRWGEKYFMQQLVDADFCSNNGGWQWSASTGVDAAPYFRVFNPARQSQRFDPEGSFIRQYVPEIADLSNKQIHAPNQVALSHCSYPTPIIDHSFAVSRVKQVFTENQALYAHTKEVALCS